jgi:hypothetical protein
MLVEIFTIDDQVVQIVIDEFKFHVVKNHIKKADEYLRTCSYSKRDTAILIQVLVRAEGSDGLRCLWQGYLMVRLIEVQGSEIPCFGKSMEGRMNIRQRDGLDFNTLIKPAVIYHSSVRLIRLGYQKHRTRILGGRRFDHAVLQETLKVLPQKLHLWRS